MLSYQLILVLQEFRDQFYKLPMYITQNYINPLFFKEKMSFEQIIIQIKLKFSEKHLLQFLGPNIEFERLKFSTTLILSLFSKFAWRPKPPNSCQIGRQLFGER